MSEPLHMLTQADLLTGMELNSEHTLADAERLLAGLREGASKWAHRTDSFSAEAIPLLESSSSRRLLGHLPLSDLEMWMEALPAETPLSQLAMTHRSPVRVQDSVLEVCRQFILTSMPHLSVVDSGGNYLGEVVRDISFEKLAAGLGLGTESATGQTFLMVETEKSGPDSFDEIYEAARAEGIRLYGYLELATSPDAEEASQTILLKLHVAYVHSFAETLRRMGYFTVNEFTQAPGSEELTRKAEEFLHFLDL